MPKTSDKVYTMKIQLNCMKILYLTRLKINNRLLLIQERKLFCIFVFEDKYLSKFNGILSTWERNERNIKQMAYTDTKYHRSILLCCDNKNKGKKVRKYGNGIVLYAL